LICPVRVIANYYDVLLQIDPCSQDRTRK